MTKTCIRKDCTKVVRVKGRVCSGCNTREHRKKYGLRAEKKYRKTINGYLVVSYSNMKNRISGRSTAKAYLYVGKSILPKDVFYLWARSSPDFLRLYKAWVMSKYDRRLAPSVNRIDSKKGYKLSNMEWITQSLNSSLSSVTRRLNNKEKKMIYDLLGVGKNEKR